MTEHTPAVNPPHNRRLSDREKRHYLASIGLTPGDERTMTCTYCDAAGVGWWCPTTNRTYLHGMWRPGQAELHIDHVIPLHHGGTNDHTNLTIACGSCNSRKGYRADWTSPNRRLVNGKWASR